MATHLPAGWYDDPADPGARRFWDGDEWTVLVAGGDSATTAAISDPGRDPSAEPEPRPQHPPSGWYADPADPGRRRYWDGAAWTSRVITRATPSASPILLDPGGTASPSVPGPGGSESVDAARGHPLSPPRPDLAEGREAVGGVSAAADEATPADTATAIADLMATVDDAEPGKAGEAVGTAPRRRRRIVVLALGLLVALVATAALTLTSRHPEPAGSDDGESAGAPSTSIPSTSTPASVPVTETVVSVDAAYDRCQDVVKASPLSTGVRLVFQPVEDVVADPTGGRTLLEFWVRERGNRDEDQRVAFVCLVGDDDWPEPMLFMQI